MLQKNVLKGKNFIKNKLRHKCFDNRLLKILRTNTLENNTGQILLIVVLNGRFILRQATELNFKLREMIKIMPPSLVVKEISLLEC